MMSLGSLILHFYSKEDGMRGEQQQKGFAAEHMCTPTWCMQLPGKRVVRHEPVSGALQEMFGLAMDEAAPLMEHLQHVLSASPAPPAAEAPSEAAQPTQPLAAPTGGAADRPSSPFSSQHHVRHFHRSPTRLHSPATQPHPDGCSVPLPAAFHILMAATARGSSLVGQAGAHLHVARSGLSPPASAEGHARGTEAGANTLGGAHLPGATFPGPANPPEAEELSLLLHMVLACSAYNFEQVGVWWRGEYACVCECVCFGVCEVF